MVEMRTSRPDEMPQLKGLWKKAFGDGERYIDWFFDCCYESERFLVVVEDGAVVSMLCLLPLEVRAPDGDIASSRYVYALATDPDCRKQGYGRQLLNYTDHFLQGTEIDCLTVVPAEPSLHRFFGTTGFSPCFSTRKLELMDNMVEEPVEGDSITPIDTQEYSDIRCDQLKDLKRVSYPDFLVKYQKGLAEMSGGNLFRIEVDGVVGCAAVEFIDEESVLMKELVIAPKCMSRAVAQIAKKFPARRYHVRTPASWDGISGSYTQPFGMLKWYNPYKKKEWMDVIYGYMGLGFD